MAWEKLKPPMAETDRAVLKTDSGSSRKGLRRKPPEALNMAAYSDTLIYGVYCIRLRILCPVHYNIMVMGDVPRPQHPLQILS